MRTPIRLNLAQLFTLAAAALAAPGCGSTGDTGGTGGHPASSSSGHGGASTGMGGAASSSTATSSSGGSGGAASSGGGSGGTASSSSGTTSGSSGSAASSSGGGSSTASSSSGGGCTAASDCPSPPAWCHVAACTSGVCGVAPAQQGALCPEGECDGAGNCICTATSCPGGGACVNGQCQPPSCVDAIENGNETDVDCGGPVCSPCVDGQICASGGDCQSGVCTNNHCKAPSCTDGVKNQSETDVDCGGGCPGCMLGEACAISTDCQSLYCAGGMCATAECTDAVKNGNETDIDCGGATCPACVNGKGCLTGADCKSGTCTNGTCVAAGPACATAAANPATGQRCPLFMPCTQSSECGVFTGCQQWFCNAGQCDLNALSSCWTSVGGSCNAQVIFTQQTAPPVDKDFLPPDGTNFRQLATIAFTVQNNTSSDLYLDEIPIQLDVTGGGSSFDVTSVKMYQDGGGTEYASGDQYVCLTSNPFSFPANGILGNGPEGGCGGSAFSRVPANGGTRRFILLLAFGANETYLAGRSYRPRMGSTAGIAFRVGFNGPTFQGTMCGIPNGGFVGAWINAKTP